VKNARFAPPGNGAFESPHFIQRMGFSEIGHHRASEHAGAANPAGAGISAVGEIRNLAVSGGTADAKGWRVAGTSPEALRVTV
jgi:hypothetical protein